MMMWVIGEAIVLQFNEKTGKDFLLK